jgi:Gpi18-like mannosyltransferase
MTGARDEGSRATALAGGTRERSWLAWRPTREHRGLAVLLVIAGLVRLAGMFGPGHGGDLYAFLTWAEGMAANGAGGYYANGGEANYPALLYLLWPLGLAFDGDVLVGAIRLLSIPFDLALGIVLFEIGRGTGRTRDGELAAAFYLLNPAVILCGPWWGQVDGVGALPMIGAIVAIGATSRPSTASLATAGGLATLAGLLKPQFGVAAFVIVGVACFWLRSREELRRVAIVAAAALATFVVVTLPLGLGPFGYLDLMDETFRRYSYHSGFAFNPWAMVFGFNRDDGSWFYLGAALEITAIVFSLWLLRLRRDLTGLLAVGALIALTLYFVPTRAHERYLFGAIALLAPLVVLDRRLRTAAAAVSAMFFVTLAYVLANSPYRILPGPKIDDLPGWAIGALSALTTLAGAWVAWQLVAVLRRPEPNGSRVAGASAEAVATGSG